MPAAASTTTTPSTNVRFFIHRAEPGLEIRSGSLCSWCPRS
jgi:hypothetical protein